MRILKFEVSHPDDIWNVLKIVWNEKMLEEKILIAQVLFTRNSWRKGVAGTVQTRSFAKQNASWEDGWWSWTPEQWSQSSKYARAYSNSFLWPPNWVQEGYGLRWYLRLIEKSATPPHACLVQTKKHQQQNESDIWRKKKHVDLGIICSFTFIFALPWRYRLIFFEQELIRARSWMPQT